MTRPSSRPRSRDEGRVFRAPSATVGAAAAAVVAILLLVDAAVRAGVGEMLLLAPWVLLVLWAVYVLVYAPHIRTDSSGVRVHNLLRITEFPWSAVRDIDLRWQVRFRLTSGQEVASFGGPVAGRPARPGLRFGGGERREPPAVRDIQVLREQWIAATEDASESRSTAEGITSIHRRWDVPALIAFVVIAAGCVIVLTFANTGF